MMWLKRNLPVLIAAVIFCFFVVLSIYLLKEAKQKQNDVEIRHRELDDKLRGLLSKSPFPSEGNIRDLRNQIVQLYDYYGKIFSSLPKEKREYAKMEIWKFKGYIEKRINAIRQDCLKRGVEVASGVNFGFGKYLGTAAPPKYDETDKLLHQLDLLESLVELLRTSGVTDITALRRTPVEGESLTDERVDGATWTKDPKLIYESQSVELGFKCSDEVLKTVLNRIANSTNAVLLVRYITVESEKAAPREPTGSDGSPARPTAAPNRPNPAFPDLRRGPGGSASKPPTTTATAPKPAAPGEPVVVMGNELATVYLRLDVLELRLPEEKGDPKKEQPKEGAEKKG